MAVPAAIPQAMWAPVPLTVRVTGQHQAPLGLAGVDPAEAGGGKGHEQPRMHADRLGDALAALEPGGEQLVGIGLVGRRTRRTAGLPADPFQLATWEELLALLDESGPDELLRQVRAAEAVDPEGRQWPRTKRSDDATAVYLQR